MNDSETAGLSRRTWLLGCGALLSSVRFGTGFSATAAPFALTDNARLADWYTGQATRNGVSFSVNYVGAPMWRAIRYTKPGGICGGPTGYWSLPPDPSALD
jgi:hypothetical protein